MAIVLFASSNCCLRWIVCADMNPVSALASFPASVLVLVSIPASIPSASIPLGSLVMFRGPA